MTTSAQASGERSTGDRGSARAAHTPTPWRVFTTKDGLKLIGVGGADGEGILDAGFGVWSWKSADGIANAELIVRAVNSHADMLKVLRETADETAEHLKNIIDAKAASFGRLDDPKYRLAFDQETARMEALVGRARAAIAKAEGRRSSDISPPSNQQ